MLRVEEIALEKIAPPRVGRKSNINEKGLKDLIRSIDEGGLINPILVRPHPRKKDFYEIVDGERRYRAFKHLLKSKLDYGTIPSMVRKLSEQAAKLTRILANEDRTDFTQYEKCLHFQELWGTGSFKSQSDMARVLGIPRIVLNEHLAVLNLPDQIVDAFSKETINFDHLRVLLRIKKESERKQLFRRIVQEGLASSRTWELYYLMKDEKLSGQRDEVGRVFRKTFSAKLGKTIQLRGGRRQSHLGISFESKDELLKVLKKMISSLKER